MSQTHQYNTNTPPVFHISNKYGKCRLPFCLFDKVHQAHLMFGLTNTEPYGLLQIPMLVF